MYLVNQDRTRCEIVESVYYAVHSNLSTADSNESDSVLTIYVNNRNNKIPMGQFKTIAQGIYAFQKILENIAANKSISYIPQEV